MNIIIIEHARRRMTKRGTSEEEIKTALEKGQEVEAKKGRKAKEKVFPFNKSRRGTFYPEKKVKVIFVEEERKIVVITVYVCYGEWGG